jgi:hypothetical protein
MGKYKKILVVCTGDLITGGPEALHCLVSEMRNLGYPAFICYYPFHKKFSIPSPYKSFNVEIHNWVDDEGVLIIFPEIMPMTALNVKNGVAAIWWLSLDYFLLNDRAKGILRQKLRYFRLALKKERPLLGVSGLKRLTHLSQSHYVSDYLLKKSLTVHPLFEPINKVFLNGFEDTKVFKRENEILYNPSKGFFYTALLVEAFPDFKFTPLRGFSRNQLIQKFSSSKIYIDFGDHPGKDRIPREAAIHGLCIITSRFGSAGNSIDVPIPETYKLIVSSKSFIQDFGKLVREIFDNFSEHHVAFDGYRNSILAEPERFTSQIRNILEKIN